MKEVRYEPLTVSSNGSGDGQETTARLLNGFLDELRYIPDATTPYGAAVTVTLTVERSGLQLWEETFDGATKKLVSPQTPVHDSAGIETGAYKRYALANDRLTITIAGAGDTKTGAFELVYYGEAKEPETVALHPS